MTFQVKMEYPFPPSTRNVEFATLCSALGEDRERGNTVAEDQMTDDMLAIQKAIETDLKATLDTARAMVEDDDRPTLAAMIVAWETVSALSEFIRMYAAKENVSGETMGLYTLMDELAEGGVEWAR